MKKLTIAATAAAIALSEAATAHEFVCEKTIDGEIVHQVDQYPATVHIKVTLTNTHPTDTSVALSLRDDFLESLGFVLAPALPLSVGVGKSIDLDFAVAIQSEAACRRMARAQACTGSAEDAFQVIFDTGVAQCAARLVCGHVDAPEGGN
jgi:hypothetical protein